MTFEEIQNEICKLEDKPMTCTPIGHGWHRADDGSTHPEHECTVQRDNIRACVRGTLIEKGFLPASAFTRRQDASDGGYPPVLPSGALDHKSGSREIAMYAMKGPGQ